MPRRDSADLEAFEDAMHKAKMEMKEEATIEELMALQEAKFKELKALHAAIAKFAIAKFAKAGAKTGAKVSKPKKAAAGAGAGAGGGDGDEEKSSTGSGVSNAWAWYNHCPEKYADNWTEYQEEWMLTHTSKRGARQSFGKHCSSAFAADHASWAAANGVSVPAVSVKPKKAATAGSEAPKKASKKAAPAEVFAEAASVASAVTGAGAGAGAAAGAGFGTMAPSQPLAAVAGVQLLLRQHSSPPAFFQTSSPLAFLQLSTVCAPAAVTSAAEASNKATLLSFFMVVL